MDEKTVFPLWYNELKQMRVFIDEQIYALENDKEYPMKSDIKEILDFCENVKSWQSHFIDYEY